MLSATNETMSMDADAIQRFNDIGFCIQFGIVIIGCVTTPLIPLFLWKVNIGSEATKVLLTFLAVADMGFLLCAMFNSIVPGSERFHMDLGYTDATCNMVFDLKKIFQTCSCWYVVMVTAERFAVIHFPLRTLNLFTWRRAVTVSSALPIIVAVIFSWAATMKVTGETKEKLIVCGNKAPLSLYEAFYSTNAGLTFISTVSITLILNTAIIMRLKRSVYSGLTTNRFNRQISVTENTNVTLSTSLNSASSGGGASEDPEDLDASRPTASSHMIRQPSTIRREDCIRKANTLVISASIVFTVTMLPQAACCVYNIVRAANGGLKSHNSTDQIVGFVGSSLAYLNPAANLLVYVLASTNLRHFTCFKRRLNTAAFV